MGARVQFDLMRLSLLSRADLYIKRKADGNIESREEWLRRIFSQKIVFLHRQESFQFVPLTSGIENVENFIIGRVGREVSIQENAPPEFQFENITRSSWKASEIVIDPTHHSDGQKVAFAVKSGFGKTLSILLSLCNAINNFNPPEPYIIEAETISDPKSFWDFVEENNGDVTSVYFEFIAPNMFGASDDYEKEMQELRDNEKISKVGLKIENPSGLMLHTDRVKSAVNYTTRGGGSIKAKSKKKNKYSSRDATKRINVEDTKENKGNLVLSLLSQAISAIKIK